MLEKNLITNLSEGNSHIQENRNPELQTHLDPCQEGVTSTKFFLSQLITALTCVNR